MGGMRRPDLVLCAAAHACSLLTLLIAAALTGVPAAAPLALPGATGMPLSWVFNVLAWIGPGLVVAAVALRLRGRLPRSGMGAGIALRLMLLAALAFAAQGLLPLDPEALDAGMSRWHAATWMVWMLAFVAAALLSGIALPSVRWPSLILCATVAICLFAPMLVGPEIATRLALACWWAWTLLLAWRLPRQH
ncbi:DUF998 domain-containing protein [Luteimonas sp. 100069]|nr:DUF998 domain-containing protein [Luteimonas sp. 100069]